jgi:serine/threonine-protein kinase
MSADVIARLNAALADRYVVEGEIGLGGMAAVYLAQDLKNHRPVALKVLDPDVAATVGAERFLREIETAANLIHPHILPLHDSGEAGGLVYYVMPYVEGESLRDRLTRERQLPVGDAVRIATEVADALDYAHRRGVVHRDIKPGNILLHDGRAQVADFGIARAVTTGEGGRLTETGISLGTPTYMSPEQAMGERDVDGRADIYALGCVLYEMLAGEPPFTGPTGQAILARILTEEARPLAESRKTVSKPLEAAVHGALEKLPADRFASASELAAALAGSAHVGPSGPRLGRGPQEAPRRGIGRGERVMWAAAVGVAVAFAVFAWTGMPPGSRQRPTWGTDVARLSIPLPDANPIVFTGLLDLTREALAISRDGRHVVYVGRDDDDRRLFLRAMDGVDPRALEGTEGGFAPFFSWDGEWVGFFTGNMLKKVRVAGGAPIVLSEVANAMGGTWGPDDTIIYGAEVGTQLVRVAADGGVPEVIARSGVGDAYFDWPKLLPDGRVLHAGWYQDLWVWDPATGEDVRLDVDGGDARYVPSGHLVYTRGSDLLAVPFDLERLERLGPETPVLSGIRTELYGAGQFDVSQTGTLVYAPGGAAALGRFAQVSPDGQAETLGLDPARFGSFNLGPDLRRLAAEVWDAAGEVWIYDLERMRPEQLTRHGNNGGPVWSPAGDRMAFWSDREGSQLAFVKALDMSTDAERIPVPFGQAVPTSWSVNGYLSLDVVTEETGWDVVAYGLEGDGATVEVAATDALEWGGSFSPDGELIAYTSSEPGRYQVFVQPFPPTGNRLQVSFGQQDAEEPLWSRDGRELFYRSGSRWMAAAVTASPVLDAGPPRVMFEGDYLNLTWRSYDLAPDGRSLLAVESLERQEATHLHVVQGWLHQLDRLAPSAR